MTKYSVGNGALFSFFFVSRNAKEIEDTCAQDAFVVHDLLYLDFCFAAVFVLAKILPGNVNIIHSS